MHFLCLRFVVMTAQSPNTQSQNKRRDRSRATSAVAIVVAVDHLTNGRLSMLKPSFAALVLVATAPCPAGLAQDTVGTLAGIITNAAGAPVAGAFVQMKNAERRLNFMVITQEQGKYSSNRLPAGKYVVQAIGGEHQSAPSTPVDVAAGKSAFVHLALNVERAAPLASASPGPSPGERGAEAAAAAGGAGPRLAEGDGKAIIAAKCITCPGAQRVVRSRGNEARWQQVLRTMTAYAQGSTIAKPLTSDEERALITYLSTNYAPAAGSTARAKPDPFSRLPRTLLPPEARGYMVVEYELPNPRAEPHEVAVDNEGNGWGSQRGGGKLGRLDHETLAYLEYEPPSPGPPIGPPHGIPPRH